MLIALLVFIGIFLLAVTAAWSEIGVDGIPAIIFFLFLWVLGLGFMGYSSWTLGWSALGFGVAGSGLYLSGLSVMELRNNFPGF